MSEWSERLERRLDPILERLERLLAGLVGEPLDARIFDAHQAFRWRATRGIGRLEPVATVSRFDLASLHGVDRAVEALDRNTRQLLAGLPYNDVLLHGERGTGKSSAVRGLLTRYAERGLRIVEVDRNDLATLPELLSMLREALRAEPDAYSFLIFCDDLSFGDAESGFRELKAALEGGIEARPPRVCVVATSNRRHLLPETMEENRAGATSTPRASFTSARRSRRSWRWRIASVSCSASIACDQPTYLEIVEPLAAREAGVDVAG